MLTLKERYYEFKKEADENFEGLSSEITDYVEELEKELERLIKFKEGIFQNEG